jgi:hypothetical protein
MRLVGTSVWIEWLTGSPLGITLLAELPDRAQWLVPTIRMRSSPRGSSE